MKHRTVLFIVLWFLSCPGLLRADQFIPLSLPELAGKAELVVLGSVLSKSCQQDDAGRIFTRVELQVTEVWKGAVSSKILIVVHGGGILGSRRIAVSGHVDYTVGEEVVAFLVRNDRGEAVTLSLAQGKFHVSQDPNASVKTVHNLFHGTPSAAGLAATMPTAGAVHRLTLPQLKQAVQESRPSAPTGQSGGLTK
jgi:molybdopterin-binding protein